MTALLKTQLGLQNVKGQHSAWSTVVAVLGNPLQQGARFMLGRLRIPWLIWQTLRSSRTPRTMPGRVTGAWQWRNSSVP
ncbi:hypothetical protein QNM99_04325 [Pseudomonas sp. PCH446]